MNLMQSSHNLDKKKRLIIPSSLRDILSGDTLIIHADTKYNFYLQSLEIYEKKYQEYKEYLKRKLEREKILYEEYNRALNMYDIHTIAKVDKDSNYRVVIPDYVVKKYDIDNSVFLCSTHEHVKVFKNEETYEQYKYEYNFRTF